MLFSYSQLEAWDVVVSQIAIFTTSVSQAEQVDSAWYLTQLLFKNGEFSRDSLIPDFHNVLCTKYFRWHPEVGKTAAPNLRNIKPQVGVKKNLHCHFLTS